MKIKTAYENTIKSLTAQFGEREASNLSRILFEDKFQINQLALEGNLSKTQEKELEEIIQKLLAGVPIQYLVGQTNFYGLTFFVNPAVLIPRPETEELVYLIMESLPTQEIQTGLDIGTGSGCIPVTLKYKCPAWKLHASDVSAAALKMAKLNAAENKSPVTFHEFDILDKGAWPELPTFDFIVSNPPYIPPSEKEVMPDSVINHEPAIALFVPEEDPLLFYRGIITFAKKQLKEGGYLFFETNEFNAAEVAKLLTQQGFENVMLEKDMQDKWRMAYATKGEK